MTHLKFSGSVIVLMFVAANGGIAFAQDNPSDTPDETDAVLEASVDEQDSDRRTLDSVTVTAQRREESAQNVPIAISTIDAELSADLGINGIEALGQLLPGVTLNRQGNGVIPYVRGVGAAVSTAGNEPSVATFIDDVYIPSGQVAVFDFNSVEAINVLRGPQGTLFGRNATGGVLQIETRDPSHEPRFDVDLSYSSYEKIHGAVYGSTGLGDKVAVNFAAYAIDQGEGWGTNVVTGKEVFLTEAAGVRAKMLIDATDDTEIILGANYDRRESDQGGFSLNIAPGTFGTGGFSREALGAGFYDAVIDFPSGYENTFEQFSAKLNHDFGPVVFKSISAYTDWRSDATSDLETSPLPFVNSVFTQGGETFTQEFQLLSDTDSAVEWILGMFYLKDSSDFSIASTGLAFGTGTSEGLGRQDTDSISGFGELTYHLTDRLTATGGLRFTSDERDYFARGEIGGAVGGPFTDSVTYDDLSGRASLKYDLTDDVMIYASYSEGFKSGVFNIAGVTGAAASAPAPVLPESLEAISAGFKSEFWQGRARLNVEAYTYDYSNIQVNTIVAGAAVTTNAAKATINGLDADFTVRPIDPWLISASMAIADGEYDSFPNGPQFFPLAPNDPIAIPSGCAATVPTYPTGPALLPYGQRACDLSGNETVQTVPFSVTLLSSYEVPTSFGDLVFTGSWAHGGDYYFEADNNENVRQPTTDIFNASVSLTRDRYEIVVWGNNLSEEEYFNTRTQSSLGSAKYSPAAPRTFGVTLKARF
ncbi:MAG: TonB-dependent receptor [Henriciella sp.]|uniref:TonB-dependent receptor n=1 Tax=Henriciella sp. TaxID=1968823 RepID=UPI0032EBFF1E